MSVAKATTGETQVELYSHKLFAPQQFSGAIRRQAILDRLLEETTARVVFLQGPAGHGKSTALQQLKSEFEARGMLTSWLTFDKADNDIRRFSIHFQAVLAKLLRKGGGKERQLADTPPRRRRSDWLIGQLLQLGKPVVMFFDDFQTLEDKLILSFFRELFERVPDGIRIIVGSRSIPEVGLARLIINRQAIALRSDDLRFSAHEVAEFFSADPQLALSDAEVNAIIRRTDGWPAALQLFRLALVSPTVRQSLGDLANYRPRELAEYLADNVVNLQTPQIQEFLLKTSVLTAMTAPLCDTVTGWSDSQSLLVQLERSGLFVRSLDSDLRWFKYHPLFSSFLAEQLRDSTPGLALEVHRRAAEWCLGQELYEETVKHALACKDFALAADTMSIWFAGLIADAQLVTVEHWCSQLPFEEIAKRPSLTVELAYALVFLRRFERLRPLVVLLKSASFANSSNGGTSASVVLSMAAISSDDVPGAFAYIEGVEVRTPNYERFNAFELGAAANLLGYRSLTMGDFEGVRDYLTIARAHNTRGEATFSAGYTIGIRGVSAMAQGRLQEALDVFRLGMAEQRMHMDKSFASAALVSCYLWSLYEANQLDQVESLFGQYRDTIAESVLLDFLAVAYVSVSRTYDARGRISSALEMLDKAETLGHTNGWSRLVRIVNWERVRRALLAGAGDRAVAIANRAGSAHPPLAEDWILFSEDIEGESLGRIR
jgi:LuxR family maltose regulon positive regulatory protein